MHTRTHTFTCIHTTEQTHTHIPQGCPLSGSVYAATSTALVHLLSTEIPAECIFMFADDLAMLLDDVERLPAVARILDIYATATNLKVDVSKTVVVPLRVHEHDSDRVIRDHKNGIGDILPEWSKVKVAMQAKYLGYQVGPSSTRDMQWKGALEEHTRRVRQTVAGGAAPSFNIRHYDTYVAALCTYVGSMYRAPLHLDHHFAVAVQRLCRFPHRAMPKGALRRMREMGLPQVRDTVLEGELAFVWNARRLSGTLLRYSGEREKSTGRWRQWPRTRLRRTTSCGRTEHELTSCKMGTGAQRSCSAR